MMTLITESTPKFRDVVPNYDYMKGIATGVMLESNGQRKSIKYKVGSGKDTKGVDRPGGTFVIAGTVKQGFCCGMLEELEDFPTLWPKLFEVRDGKVKLKKIYDHEPLKVDVEVTE